MNVVCMLHCSVFLCVPCNIPVCNKSVNAEISHYFFNRSFLIGAGYGVKVYCSFSYSLYTSSGVGIPGPICPGKMNVES